MRWLSFGFTKFFLPFKLTEMRMSREIIIGMTYMVITRNPAQGVSKKNHSIPDPLHHFCLSSSGEWKFYINITLTLFTAKLCPLWRTVMKFPIFFTIHVLYTTFGLIPEKKVLMDENDEQRRTPTPTHSSLPQVPLRFTFSNNCLCTFSKCLMFVNPEA